MRARGVTPVRASRLPMEDANRWAAYLGKPVVLDTRSAYIYIGTLTKADEWWLELSDVDVHDSSEGHSTKEKYVMEARKFGVKSNRKRVSVRREFIVSLSLLEDVVEY